MSGLRARMERISGLDSSQVRVEVAQFVPKEGRSEQGCPVAKYVSGYFFPHCTKKLSFLFKLNAYS